jgi:Kef-type K+ transport system membrane component KefB
MEQNYAQLTLIAGAALLAPLVSGLPRHVRLPVVVVELMLGILLGPHVLNFAQPTGLIDGLSELGLTFLLFMVGYEIDVENLRGPVFTKAATGWILSFGLGLVLMELFHATGLISAPPLMAAVALSTTALGVLIPILRDNGEIDTPFGQRFLPVATLGEFGPLMVISLLLIPTHATVLHTLFIVLFLGLAFLVAFGAHHPKIRDFGQRLATVLPKSGEFQVRLCILIQAVFVLLASHFGLNVVIGAFAAGLIVRLFARETDHTSLEEKLNGIGYGFLIPFFFIVAGLRFDPSLLATGPMAAFQVVGLLILLLIIRGVPVFLYSKEMSLQDKLRFTLYSATGLPIIVIVTEIGISSELMRPERAAALLCAGMISVFLFPLLAEKIKASEFRP